MVRRAAWRRSFQSTHRPVLAAWSRLGILPRLTTRSTTAIGNAFLRWRVCYYKHSVATDTNSLILQLPNAITGETGSIVPINIAYDDASRDIDRYPRHLDLISTRCKCDAGTSR